jgi:hypothetical protein
MELSTPVLVNFLLIEQLDLLHLGHNNRLDLLISSFRGCENKLPIIILYTL